MWRAASSCYFAAAAAVQVAATASGGSTSTSAGASSGGAGGGCVSEFPSCPSHRLLRPARRSRPRPANAGPESRSEVRRSSGGTGGASTGGAGGGCTGVFNCPRHLVRARRKSWRRHRANVAPVCTGGGGGSELCGGAGGVTGVSGGSSGGASGGGGVGGCSGASTSPVRSSQSISQSGQNRRLLRHHRVLPGPACFRSELPALAASK